MHVMVKIILSVGGMVTDGSLGLNMAAGECPLKTRFLKRMAVACIRSLDHTRCQRTWRSDFTRTLYQLRAALSTIQRPQMTMNKGHSFGFWGLSQSGSPQNGWFPVAFPLNSQPKGGRL